MNMDSTPMPDLPLLRKVVEWVEEQSARPKAEREWDQRMWYWTEETRRPHVAQEGYCGTTYCVAGKVCEDAGFDWTLWPEAVSDAAARVLGLSERQADDLFDANNSASRVREVAESIAGERL